MNEPRPNNSPRRATPPWAGAAIVFVLIAIVVGLTFFGDMETARTAIFAAGAGVFAWQVALNRSAGRTGLQLVLPVIGLAVMTYLAVRTLAS